jgi:hypothetical protein
VQPVKRHADESLIAALRIVALKYLNVVFVGATSSCSFEASLRKELPSFPGALQGVTRVFLLTSATKRPVIIHQRSFAIIISKVGHALSQNGEVAACGSFPEAPMLAALLPLKDEDSRCRWTSEKLNSTVSSK